LSRREGLPTARPARAAPAPPMRAREERSPCWSALSAVPPKGRGPAAAYAAESTPHRHEPGVAEGELARVAVHEG